VIAHMIAPGGRAQELPAIITLHIRWAARAQEQPADQDSHSSKGRFIGKSQSTLPSTTHLAYIQLHCTHTLFRQGPGATSYDSHLSKGALP
jgi:hypothetical protein